MRILILTPDIYTRGGIARYTSALASTLGGLVGAENVHVLPLLGAGESGESPGQCSVFEPAAGRVNTTSKIRFACRAISLAAKNYDLVISTHIGLSPVAAMLRLISGTPCWIVCHGSESWRKFPADVRWALRHADLILPVSRFTAEMVTKMNAFPSEKLRVLYNAVPDGFARLLTAPCTSIEPEPPASEKVKTILSVGMISRPLSYKGFDTVIAALPRVLDRVPDARYVIAGGGDDIGRLKRLAAEAGVSAKVEFKGIISDAELVACYRACDVFVLPSRSRMGRVREGEGFGRVYVEAALAGKPVVGSTAGGAAESVLHQKTGLLVDPDSVSEVAHALIYIFENPEAAARMGREGLRWASMNFTSETLQRRLKELLGEYGFSHNPASPASEDALQAFNTIETESSLSANIHVS